MTRGKPARRRHKREHGECICGKEMEWLTDCYAWCNNCGRLYEKTAAHGRWRFAAPKLLREYAGKKNESV